MIIPRTFNNLSIVSILVLLFNSGVAFGCQENGRSHHSHSRTHSHRHSSHHGSTDSAHRHTIERSRSNSTTDTSSAALNTSRLPSSVTPPMSSSLPSATYVYPFHNGAPAPGYQPYMQSYPPQQIAQPPITQIAPPSGSPMLLPPAPVISAPTTTQPSAQFVPRPQVGLSDSTPSSSQQKFSEDLQTLEKDIAAFAEKSDDVLKEFIRLKKENEAMKAWYRAEEAENAQLKQMIEIQKQFMNIACANLLANPHLNPIERKVWNFILASRKNREFVMDHISEFQRLLSLSEETEGRVKEVEEEQLEEKKEEQVEEKKEEKE